MPAPSRRERARGPSEEELTAALARMLELAGEGAPLALRRQRSPYASSFPLEELTVALRGGRQLRLALKRVQRGALAPGARAAKPAFLLDERREALVYSRVLPQAPSGPPRCYGAFAPARGGGRCLVVEWVAGRELFQLGGLEAWEQAARWLARMHAALAPAVEEHARAARLIEHDARFHRRWLARARRFAAGHERAREAAGFLRGLQRRYEQVVEALVALPRTVLHGDFYASNVLVSDRDDGLRVAPVDWEMAGAGAGLTDLAALLSGGWTAAERERMTAAYASCLPAGAFSPRELELARLALSVQRLGWAPPGWAPPRSQRHDWLADAAALAESLGI